MKCLHGNEELEFLDDLSGLNPLKAGALRNAWKDLHVCRFEALVHARSASSRRHALCALSAWQYVLPRIEAIRITLKSEAIAWDVLECALQRIPPGRKEIEDILENPKADSAAKVRAQLIIQFMTFVIAGPKAERNLDGSRISCTNWNEVFRIMAYRASWLLTRIERELALSRNPEEKLKDFPLSVYDISTGNPLWERLDASLHDDVPWPPPVPAASEWPSSFYRG